jgi:hypothetical protein
LGGYTFMKNTFTILLSSLLLCGCSQKQASGPAIDRVKTGDTSWTDGPTVYTLHVTKRSGAELEGVSISAKLPTGQTQMVSGDTATLSTPPNATDDKSVMVTIHKAKIKVDSQSSDLGGDYPMLLHE